MNCCQRLSRFFIAFISLSNIIWLVVSIILIYTRYKNKEWYKMVNIHSTFVFILIAIILGLVSSIIGLVFYCGVPKCLSFTYFILIVASIIFEVISIILISRYKDDIVNSIENNWNKSKYRKVRISVEKHYRCCGFKTPELQSECGYNPSYDVDDLCYDVLKRRIEDNKTSYLIAGIITAFIELLLLICAFCLICSCKDD